MTVWCYLATMTTDPGGVPPGWHPFTTETDLEAGDGGPSPTASTTIDALQEPSFAMRLSELYQTPQAVASIGDDAEERARFIMERPRWCKKCNAWKPPRSHHCSMSRRCVLKMDHFCVWVSNTVGLLNYKQFVLFLVWAFLGCVIR